MPHPMSKEKLQSAVNKFIKWKDANHSHIRDYRVESYYEPKLALLGFLKTEFLSNADDRLIFDHESFCDFAKEVKAQNATCNISRLCPLGSAVCTKREFDDVLYEHTHGTKTHETLFKALAFLTFLYLVDTTLTLWRPANNKLTQKISFSAKDVTTHATPNDQIDIFAQYSHLQEVHNLESCITEHNCPKQFWKGPPPPVNDKEAFTQYLFPSNHTQMRFYRNSNADACSVKTFFKCVDSTFSKREIDSTVNDLKSRLLLTDGKCIDDTDGSCFAPPVTP